MKAAQHCKYVISLLLLDFTFSTTAVFIFPAAGQDLQNLREKAAKQLNDSTAAARQTAEKLLEEARAAGQDSFRVIALNTLGELDRRAGRSDDAIKRHRQAAKLAAQIDAPNAKLLEYDAFSGLGKAYFWTGNADSSVACFEIARKAAISIEIPLLVADADNNTGNVYYQLSRPDSALKYYRTAFEKYLALGREDYAVPAISNIANIYLEQGDPDKAMRYARKGQKLIVDKAKRPLQVANLANNLGYAFACSSDPAAPDSALRYLQDALAIYESAGASIQAAVVHRNISAVYLNMEEWEAAERHAVRGLEIAQTTENKEFELQL